MCWGSIFRESSLRPSRLMATCLKTYRHMSSVHRLSWTGTWRYAFLRTSYKDPGYLYLLLW